MEPSSYGVSGNSRADLLTPTLVKLRIPRSRPDRPRDLPRAGNRWRFSRTDLTEDSRGSTKTGRDSREAIRAILRSGSSSFIGEQKRKRKRIKEQRGKKKFCHRLVLLLAAPWSSYILYSLTRWHVQQCCAKCTRRRNGVRAMPSSLLTQGKISGDVQSNSLDM